MNKDFLEARRLLRKAAEHGHVGAQLELASIYIEGKGVTVDFVEAAEWLYPAATSGTAVAQAGLGDILQSDRGVKPDLVQSWMWFSLAVSGGYTEAKEALANVTSRLSPAELQEAQRLYHNFTPQAPSEVHKSVGAPMRR